jgi:hypothetical protein
MRNTITKSLALFGAFMLSLLSVSAAHADEQRPFKADYTSTITFTSPSTATLAGEGTATHMGHALTTGSLAQVGAATSCADGFLAELQDTLTAANGDQVTIVINLEACPIAPGIYQGAGTYFVTGGTGRFVGATGEGVFSGIGDFNTGTVACRLEGTISM